MPGFSIQSENPFPLNPRLPFSISSIPQLKNTLG